MPNWCNNIVTIQHKNKDAIDRVVNAFNEGKLCSEFIPIPEELANTKSPNDDPEAYKLVEKYGYSNWYDFCVHQWGTKWDVGGNEDYFFEPERKTDTEVTLTFDSAWSPPVGLYDMLLKKGYDLTAYYYESGMAFAGKYTEDGDDCYDLSGDYKTVRKEIPSDIDEMFRISETMEEEHDELENLMGGEE